MNKAKFDEAFDIVSNVLELATTIALGIAILTVLIIVVW